MLNSAITHPFLTLIWLVCGLIIWAWTNFNMEINDPEKNRGILKYVCLIGMLVAGPFSSIAFFLFFYISFGYFGYKVKLGLKFN